MTAFSIDTLQQELLKYLAFDKHVRQELREHFFGSDIRPKKGSLTYKTSFGRGRPKMF